MKRMIRVAAAAVLVSGGIGCTHSHGDKDGAAGGGGVYRSFVDPCWPERYNMTARSEVLAPFAQQVNNGTVMHQTLWNWYFEKGTDKLTPAGMAKLDSIAQTRPAPDPRLYLQAARDLEATNDNLDKIAADRETLTSKRAAVVMKYLSAQPAIGNPTPYEVFVHDTPTLGMPASFTAATVRDQQRGYVGSLPGAAGGGSGGGTTTNTGSGPSN
jgi:hypothetical protein